MSGRPSTDRGPKVEEVKTGLTHIAQEIRQNCPRSIQLIIAQVRRNVDQGCRDDRGVQAGEHETHEDAKVQVSTMRRQTVCEETAAKSYMMVRKFFLAFAGRFSGPLGKSSILVSSSLLGGELSTLMGKVRSSGTGLKKEGLGTSGDFLN